MEFSGETTGTGSTPGEPIDWQAKKAEILGRLDIAAEYEALGIEFTRGQPSAKGWRECRAIDRRDANPSAAVQVVSGVYHDSGGEGLTLGLFDFALRFGHQFGRWIDVLRYYAERAGIELGTVPTHGAGKIREAWYDYRDPDGRTCYRVFRYRLPNGRSTFTQHPPDGRGGWRYGAGCMDGIEPLPYRLPELLAADPTEPVWVVEGEKDAERAATLGLISTTSHQGAQSTRRTWPRFLGYFAGRAVRIIPDNDQAGRDHVRRVAEYLRPVAASVRIVALPGLPAHGDLSVWIDQGHTRDELEALAAAAPEFDPIVRPEPEPEPEPAQGHGCEPPAADPDELPATRDVFLTCLTDVQATPLEWLWPDRMALKKISLLAGEAKLGKSFLTMWLAATVSRGGEIPCGGGECMPQGAVVLLSAEDDLEDTIKPRLLAAGADTDRIHALTAIRLPDGRKASFSLAYLPYLERAIVDRPDTRLVIIDPITQYLGAGIDDNKNVQLRAALGPLRELAIRRRLAVVILSHLNKGNGTKALNRVMGSGAYTAFARSNWLVVRDPRDRKRRLFLDAGNNLVEEVAGLAYRIDPERGCVVWEDQPVLMSADEALEAEHETTGPRNGNGNGSADRAAAWLREQLADGEIPSETIFATGKAAGYSRDALYTAKARLGIKARKQGFGPAARWCWCPPEPDNGHLIGHGAIDDETDNTPF